MLLLGCQFEIEDATVKKQQTIVGHAVAKNTIVGQHTHHVKPKRRMCFFPRFHINNRIKFTVTSPAGHLHATSRLPKHIFSLMKGQMEML